MLFELTGLSKMWRIKFITWIPKMCSNIKYHTCQSHVNCHVVSYIDRCRCIAKCQEVDTQYHQREWTHTVILSITKPLLFTEECWELLTEGSSAGWLTGLEASVHAIGTEESVTDATQSQLKVVIHVWETRTCNSYETIRTLRVSQNRT